MDFLRNVEIMVLVEVYGQIGQKANWANCFFSMCTGNVTNYNYNIYNNKYNIYIIFIINLEK